MGAEGKLFVISGPSGVGKGTVVGQVLARLPRCELSISATTRSPRPGEVDGVSYHFLSDEAFDRLIAEDGFLEWATFSGHRYGTLRKAVLERLEAGFDVILEIDVQGAALVRASLPDAVLIFIAPPSLEELERRLRERGTETEAVIRKRLDAAKVELSRQKDYDAVFVNDDLQRCVDELSAYMTASET